LNASSSTVPSAPPSLRSNHVKNNNATSITSLPSCQMLTHKRRAIAPVPRILRHSKLNPLQPLSKPFLWPNLPSSQSLIKALGS